MIDRQVEQYMSSEQVQQLIDDAKERYFDLWHESIAELDRAFVRDYGSSPKTGIRAAR